MISQLRIYTINKGQMDSWLKTFDGLKPILARHGIQVNGAWTDAENERFIWVRSFEDEADLARKEEAFYSDPDWLAGVDHVRSHLAKRDVTVINPI
ncbi:MAG: NIPSNAP family protein [Chloroflexi bacterium]|nr:NIPSNAP family protein [Chloroflexota bacterium]